MRLDDLARAIVRFSKFELCNLNFSWNRLKESVVYVSPIRLVLFQNDLSAFSSQNIKISQKVNISAPKGEPFHLTQSIDTKMRFNNTENIRITNWFVNASILRTHSIWSRVSNPQSGSIFCQRCMCVLLARLVGATTYLEYLESWYLDTLTPISCILLVDMYSVLYTLHAYIIHTYVHSCSDWIWCSRCRYVTQHATVREAHVQWQYSVNQLLYIL